MPPTPVLHPRVSHKQPQSNPTKLCTRFYCAFRDVCNAIDNLGDFPAAFHTRCNSRPASTWKWKRAARRPTVPAEDAGASTGCAATPKRAPKRGALGFGVLWEGLSSCGQGAIGVALPLHCAQGYGAGCFATALGWPALHFDLGGVAWGKVVVWRPQL